MLKDLTLTPTEVQGFTRRPYWDLLRTLVGVTNDIYQQLSSHDTSGGVLPPWPCRQCHPRPLAPTKTQKQTIVCIKNPDSVDNRQIPALGFLLFFCSTVTHSPVAGRWWVGYTLTCTCEFGLPVTIVTGKTDFNKHQCHFTLILWSNIVNVHLKHAAIGLSMPTTPEISKT